VRAVFPLFRDRFKLAKLAACVRYRGLWSCIFGWELWLISQIARCRDWAVAVLSPLRGCLRFMYTNWYTGRKDPCMLLIYLVLITGGS